MSKKAVLGPTARQWLKCIHMIVSVAWIGGGLAMVVLRSNWMSSGLGDPYTLNVAVDLINDWIILPAALVVLITGILWSWLTPWGFFKHRWLTVKWIVTMTIVIGSAVVTSPWDREMEAISRLEGLMSLQNPDYLHYELLVNAAGVGKVTALISLAVISVFKPWRKRA